MALPRTLQQQADYEAKVTRKEEAARSGAVANAEYQAAADARMANMARLRELRLAQAAAMPPAKRKRK